MAVDRQRMRYHGTYQIKGLPNQYDLADFAFGLDNIEVEYDWEVGQTVTLWVSNLGDTLEMETLDGLFSSYSFEWSDCAEMFDFDAPIYPSSGTGINQDDNNEPLKNTLSETKHSQRTNNNSDAEGGCRMKMGNMNFNNMFKGFNMRQLGEDEIGMGFDGKTYFKRKNGDYVRYDAASQQIINTHEMKFDFGMVMVIPSPTVQVGDMIVNGNEFVHITKTTKQKIFGVGLESGRTKSIVKEASALGLNFYQKVVNLMDNSNGQNMFGNINPLMFMMMTGDKSGSDNKMQDMLQMMLMSQMFGGAQNQNSFGQFVATQPGQNPFAQIFGGAQSSSNELDTDLDDTEEELTNEEIDAEIERLQSLKK